MDIDHLVQMANDIGNYFSSDPDRANGVAGMGDHIQRFWEPRMRKQIGAQRPTHSGISSSPDPDRPNGVAGMVDHIRRFWEPRMRKQIAAHLDAGGEGLSEIARAAIVQLAAQRSAA